MNWKIS